MSVNLHGFQSSRLGPRLAYLSPHIHHPLRRQPPRSYGKPSGSSSQSSLVAPSPMLHARSFPTELLLIIFSFLFDDLASYCIDSHEAHRECAVCNSSAGSGAARKHVVWDWQDDVYSHALFPYSLASVCRRWRDIMASMPHFWTRLIIFLDAPLVDFRSHLQWSGQLPIEVYVLRRRHSTSLGIDRSERTRSRQVFEAIKPHLHRCHILRFSLLQSTSLPSLIFDFAGANAPLLTDLRLECEVDDQRDDIPLPIPPRIIPHPNMKFNCPILTAVSLNGRNFRDLSLAIHHGYDFWLPTIHHIEKVICAHYSAGSPQAFEFTLSHILQVIRRERMPHLNFFKLVDVDLRLPDSPTPSHVELTALNIHLEELDSEVINQFSASVDVVHDLESFHVVRSSIPDLWDIPDTCDLMLEEVNDLRGVNSPVKDWIGNRLVFTGCNGFNDEVLRMLRSSGNVPFPTHTIPNANIIDTVSVGGPLPHSLPPPPVPVGVFNFNCSNLQEIYLNDCINYSVPALKMVIAARNAGLMPLGRKATESDGPPCILELYVTGIGPELSAQDKEWFEQRLPLFYWETKSREG